MATASRPDAPLWSASPTPTIATSPETSSSGVAAPQVGAAAARAISDPEEALRVGAEDARARLDREVGALAQRLRALRELAVPVRIVARVEDEVGAERLDHRREQGLAGLAGDV